MRYDPPRKNIAHPLRGLREVYSALGLERFVGAVEQGGPAYNAHADRAGGFGDLTGQGISPLARPGGQADLDELLAVQQFPHGRDERLADARLADRRKRVKPLPDSAKVTLLLSGYFQHWVLTHYATGQLATVRQIRGENIVCTAIV